MFKNRFIDAEAEEQTPKEEEQHRLVACYHQRALFLKAYTIPRIKLDTEKAERVCLPFAFLRIYIFAEAVLARNRSEPISVLPGQLPPLRLLFDLSLLLHIPGYVFLFVIIYNSNLPMLSGHRGCSGYLY